MNHVKREITGIVIISVVFTLILYMLARATTIPAPMSLVSPASNATGQSITPTLRWDVSTNATTYQCQISTHANFSDTLRDSASIADTFLVSRTLSNLTKYYWRVNASSADTTIAYKLDSFTTIIAVPATPTLARPANALTGFRLGGHLFWNTAARATSYECKVSTHSDLSAPAIDSTLTDTILRIPMTFSAATVYYWSVRGINVGGNGSYASMVHFTTRPSSPVPVACPDSPCNTRLNGIIGQ